jgi:hypothetical protein
MNIKLSSVSLRLLFNKPTSTVVCFVHCRHGLLQYVEGSLPPFGKHWLILDTLKVTKMSKGVKAVS